MSSLKNEGGQQAVKLAVLTAAIGAGFAGSAQAAFISTSGSAGLPKLFDLSAGSPSDALDLNGDGTTDFTINVDTGSDITILAGTNSVHAFAGYADPNASLAAFTSPSSLKVLSGAVPIVAETSPGIFGGFPEPPPEYYEVVFGSPSGNEYEGYIAGTVTETSNDATFDLTDYGYNTVPVSVPEPSSLALLAAGAAGLGVLRRRRARPN